MNDPLTLSFDSFLTWLQQHTNCIIRAGTPETLIYDDDDLHWQFAAEGGETVVAQVLHGKRLRGEILIAPETVAYVQGTAGEQEGEYIFEMINETETGRVSAYFFVLTHGFDDESPPAEGRVH